MHLWAGRVAANYTRLYNGERRHPHRGLELMGGPSETDQVVEALRFGWAFAEVRGRMRMGDPQHLTGARPDHALPLGDERSWLEQTIETEKVVQTLAEHLGLDFQRAELTGQHGQKGTAATELTDLGRALKSARDSGNPDQRRVRWDDLSNFFYLWDAKIQDTLAADSFAVASGYQLGRGLAETYWALDPGIADLEDPRSWMFLFGTGRVRALERLLPRLSGYFKSTTASAIQSSVAAWAQVASEAELRSRPETVNALHEQLRVWHDLLLVGQPPESRVASKSLLKRARQLGPVLRAFVPELSVGLLSVAAAAGAAVLFTIGHTSHAIAPVLAVLSFFGVTSAGALAKAKDKAHALFADLRETMNGDLVKDAITLPPARAYLDTVRRRGRGGRRRLALRQLEAAQEIPDVQGLARPTADTSTAN